MEDPYPGETGIFGIAGLLSAGGGGGYALKIVILVVLVLLSAFFSSAETAFTSVNRVRLKTLAQDGNKKAKVATMLVDRYDKMLYSTLIGNNIVNIAASSIATLLFIDVLKDNNLGSTVATIVTTVALLIFGEITPKTLAKMVPEKFCMAYGYFIYAIMIVFTPLSLVFSGWKALILKIFKFKPDEGITEEELITIVEEAGEEGSLDDNETHLIRSAIEFNDLDVEDIYVPRVNVIAVEKSASMQEIRDLFAEHSFSRLPVYEDNIDHIIGMIHEKDFYNALAKGHTSIESSITKIALATEHMKISTLLKSLQKQKVHMAVVVDEYGGTCGIVTLEDILEELVGEIWDEHDEEEVLYGKINEGEYWVDGKCSLDELFDLYEDLKGDCEDCESNTVGGWVTEKFGRIPANGEVITIEDIEVKVVKATKQKILKIRVKQIELSEEEADKKD